MHTSEHQETFVVPIGPQHPALKEPGHFAFTVEGETVRGATVRLGYVHRGIEKATETRNWTQNLYLLERVCGICSHTHATAYALGVERLAGVQAPPRAQAIRNLFCELERIHSHLLWLGMAAHEAGFDTLFMFAWRDREAILDVLEQLCGNRVNYSANVLGGVKFDVGDAQAEAIHAALNMLQGRTEHYLRVISTDASFLRRTAGIGCLSPEAAQVAGLVGPMARASGLRRDLRVEAPYAAYGDFPINMVVETGGDVKARFVVRLRELLESYAYIRALLPRLPAGDLTARMPRKIKAGETVSRVEAPRGELFYFIASNGTDVPERVHVRTPTVCNLASVITTAIDHKLADMPVLLAGVDPCFSCNDRAVIVNHAQGHEHWTWQRLRQHALDYYGRPKEPDYERGA